MNVDQYVRASEWETTFWDLGFDHRMHVKIKNQENLRIALNLDDEACVNEIITIFWDLGFDGWMQAKFGNFQQHFK